MITTTRSRIARRLQIFAGAVLVSVTLCGAGPAAPSSLGDVRPERAGRQSRVTASPGIEPAKAQHRLGESAGMAGCLSAFPRILRVGGTLKFQLALPPVQSAFGTSTYPVQGRLVGLRSTHDQCYLVVASLNSLSIRLPDSYIAAESNIGGIALQPTGDAIYDPDMFACGALSSAFRFPDSSGAASATLFFVRKVGGQKLVRTGPEGCPRAIQETS